MNNIKFYNQIEMKSPPTKPEHIITKKYFEENQLEIPESGGHIIVDSDNNEVPQRKYLKFFNSDITDLQFEDTTLVNIRGGGGQGAFDILEIVGDDTTTEYIFAHDFNTKNILYSTYNKETGAEASFNFARISDTEIKISMGKPLGTDNNYVLVLFAIDSSRKIPVDNIKNLESAAGNQSVMLKWEDPENVEEAGEIVAAWKGTRIMRKLGAFPVNEDDGILVVDNQEKNKYSEEGFIDTGLTENIEYFYQLFPYTENYVFNRNTTNRISVTPILILPNPITNLQTIIGDQKISINYTNPTGEFSGVRLVYKIGEFPSDINDGTVIINYVSGTPITGLTNDIEYFFRFFSFNKYENFNSDEEQQIIGIPVRPPYKVWGVRIDTTDSNPDTSSVYTDDCLVAPPTNFGEKPCVLKNGVVQYYLNPNDFTKKEDGSAAVITGSDGDVMIEIPKLAYLIKYTGNYLDVKITTHPDAKELNSDFCYYGHTRDTEGDLSKIYVGAYLGKTVSGKLRSISGVLPSDTKTIATFRTEAQANGAGYDQISFYPLTLLQCMYLVKYRNLNGQTALGRGYVDANASYIKTGGTDTKGMYYGETTGKLQMKFAGIEDFWGNKVFRIDGYITNANREILTGFKNFSDSGAGYTNQGYAVAADLEGYCKKVVGTNNSGFITVDSTGSATTYYCDHNYRCASCVASFGGVMSSADAAGALQVKANAAASYSTANHGARLMFRPTS